MPGRSCRFREFTFGSRTFQCLQPTRHFQNDPRIYRRSKRTRVLRVDWPKQSSPRTQGLRRQPAHFPPEQAVMCKCWPESARAGEGRKAALETNPGQATGGHWQIQPAHGQLLLDQAKRQVKHCQLTPSKATKQSLGACVNRTSRGGCDCKDSRARSVKLLQGLPIEVIMIPCRHPTFMSGCPKVSELVLAIQVQLLGYPSFGSLWIRM